MTLYVSNEYSSDTIVILTKLIRRCHRPNLDLVGS